MTAYVSGDGVVMGIDMGLGRLSRTESRASERVGSSVGDYGCGKFDAGSRCGCAGDGETKEESLDAFGRGSDERSLFAKQQSTPIIRIEAGAGLGCWATAGCCSGLWRSVLTGPAFFGILGADWVLLQGLGTIGLRSLTITATLLPLEQEPGVVNQGETKV